MMVLLTAADGRRVRRHLHRRADPASTADVGQSRRLSCFSSWWTVLTMLAVEFFDLRSKWDATSFKEVRHA